MQKQLFQSFFGEIFRGHRGGHSGLNQGVRLSYYNFQIPPGTLCTISTDCFAETPVTVSFDSCVVVFIIFIFMSFDIGRRRVLLTMKYILTRLTYNCAHLRLTKESLTVEFANKNR